MVCFFFNDTTTTEIYTLSLHDALPIGRRPVTVQPDHAGVRGVQHRAVGVEAGHVGRADRVPAGGGHAAPLEDRKSTRLNSSHANISYAVFCLKNKHPQAGVAGWISTPS